MRKRILWVIAILLLLFIILFFFVRWEEAPEKGELTLYGNVDVRQIDIGFRVAGRISKLYFEEGDFVKKGQLLAELEKNPYNAQVSQAEANVESARANFENAKTLLERRKKAVGFGGVSKQELDTSTSSYHQLQGALFAAEAQLTVAKDNESYTRVCAPTDGIILSRIREPGTAVNPVDPVYTLSVISPVWIRAYVDEPHLGSICYGMRGKIYTDSGKVYEGQIGFISPQAEFTPKTVETTELRTDLVYRLRVYADNPDCYLKQGMPVTVKLPLTGQKCE